MSTTPPTTPPSATPPTTPPSVTSNIEKIEFSAGALLLALLRQRESGGRDYKLRYTHQGELLQNSANDERLADGVTHPKVEPLICVLDAILVVLKVPEGDCIEEEIIALKAELNKYKEVNPLFVQGINFP